MCIADLQSSQFSLHPAETKRGTEFERLWSLSEIQPEMTTVCSQTRENFKSQAIHTRLLARLQDHPALLNARLGLMLSKQRLVSPHWAKPNYPQKCYTAYVYKSQYYTKLVSTVAEQAEQGEQGEQAANQWLVNDART